MVDLLRPVLDLGDVLEEHGPAVEHADHQIAQLPGVGEGLAGLDADQPVVAAEVAGRLADVGRLDGPLQLQRRDVIGGHPVRVHQHLHHPRPPAHDVGPRHVRQAGQPLGDFLGHAAERHVVDGGIGDWGLGIGGRGKG